MQEKEEQALCLEDITRWRRYGKLTADRISLQIKKGESVLIFGREGDGIRELMGVLTGLQQPEEGRVIREGKFAVIPEDFPVLRQTDVAQAMIFPLLLEGKTREKAWKEAKKDLKESVLWEKRSTKTGFLSGYEKCVLMLLMAQSIAPDIVFLGNCMKLLTKEERQRFFREVESYRKDRKITLICLADEGELPYPFERKYRLEDGYLKEETGEKGR